MPGEPRSERRLQNRVIASRFKKRRRNGYYKDHPPARVEQSRLKTRSGVRTRALRGIGRLASFSRRASVEANYEHETKAKFINNAPLNGNSRSGYKLEPGIIG